MLSSHLLALSLSLSLQGLTKPLEDVELVRKSSALELADKSEASSAEAALLEAIGGAGLMGLRSAGGTKKNNGRSSGASASKAAAKHLLK